MQYNGVMLANRTQNGPWRTARCQVILTYHFEPVYWRALFKHMSIVLAAKSQTKSKHGSPPACEQSAVRRPVANAPVPVGGKSLIARQGDTSISELQIRETTESCRPVFHTERRTGMHRRYRRRQNRWRDTC